MKKTLLIILFLSTKIFSQYNWEKVNYAFGEIVTTKSYGNILLVASRNSLFLSSNEGSTWNVIKEFIGEDDFVTDIVMNNENQFYLSRRNGSIYKTIDMGYSWQEITKINNYVWRIYSFENDSLYIICDKNIYVLSEQNNQIEEIPIPELNGLSVWSFYKDHRGFYLAGTNCGIWKTSDNGENWISTGHFECGDVEEILSNSLGHIYLEGSDRFDGIQKSTDEGESWTQLIDSINYSFGMFIDEYDYVYLTSRDPVETDVFKVINDTNWVKIGIDSLLFYREIIRTHAGNLFVNSPGQFANNSWIRVPQYLLKGTEEITSIKEESLNHQFSISPNYPNPFNPHTKIEYSLNYSSHINLSVYSIGGQEIDVLVDEYQPTGNYSILFDASNLSSGVYIIKLTNNNYSLTRKMLLLK